MPPVMPSVSPVDPEYFSEKHVEHLVLPLLIQDPAVTVKAIFTSTGFEESTSDEDVGIVLDTTSFYAEQGGQVNSRLLILLESYVVRCFTI